MDNDLENLRKRVVTFCDERGYSLAPEAERIMGDIVRIKGRPGIIIVPAANSETRILFVSASRYATVW